ncbi:SDR family NAD(P)-dependent oxidoreductase [Spirillospora sp. NPDC048911]|uniref:SDR family NAD(P)-dependent oxidoreductase n=1 Tax=Spirillospora sp. NPDC048911 TaxID=3364527 RepID=UPI003723B369
MTEDGEAARGVWGVVPPRTAQATRTALVTGAGSGLGALAAQRLAAAGWDVVGVDVDEAGLGRTAARSPNMHTRICDVADPKAVEAVVAETGEPHRVVHAAGISPLGPALEQPLDEVERVIRINYLGTVHVVRATLPGMLARGHGELILFSSLAGWLSVPLTSAYAAAKAAVNAYAETLVHEHGDSGVKIRCVCPAQVDTPMLRRIVARYPAVGRTRIMEPRLVLDEIDRSLARPARDLYVLPGGRAKAAVFVQRHAPRLLGLALRQAAGRAGGTPEAARTA